MKNYFFSMTFNIPTQSTQKFAWGIGKFDLDKPIQDQVELGYDGITDIRFVAFNEV